MTPLPPQYGLTMVDPYTGLVIPKTVEGNLAWRKKMLAAARGSRQLQRELRQAAATSPIYFTNLFLWTFHQKKVADSGVGEQAVYGDKANVPFITWPVQDEAIQLVVTGIDTGQDVMIRKARDMGATWIILGTYQHYFQFRANTTFLELSRKEVLVDSPGDMDSLFEKHRYMLRWQPEWLRPQVRDKRMYLENADNGSSITGESTNSDAGQASRKTSVFLDEFARMKNGHEIVLATKDTTACRVFNSTPGGPTAAHTTIYQEMVDKKRKGIVIELPWWRHPEKGKDAKLVLDPVTGKHRWTNAWYEDQVQRRSKKDVAQNLDMEFGSAGDLFFSREEVETHRRNFERPPLTEGDITTVEDALTPDELGLVVRRQKVHAVHFSKATTRKRWRLWTPLVADEHGLLRPNQETRYVFGVDISGGTGASNSVISVLDNSTNLIVAKFWDAFTSPEELAIVVGLAGAWFGGKQPPLVVFEKNGPGSIFGRKLLNLGYPNIYYQRTDNAVTDRKTPRWGWTSSNARKEMMLGEYRDALKNAAIINPCREALDEALQYVYDDHGRLEPGSHGEDGGGNALHGDHVIADGLLVLGRKDLPKTEREAPPKPPPGSFEYRRLKHKNRDKEREAWSK